MACRKLLPFDLVEKPKFTNFVQQNCQFAVTSALSLSSTVLTNINGILKVKVKNML